MPDSPQLELAFTATIDLAPQIDVGETPYGRRISFPIIGGSFEGPNLKGVVMPGGEDFALILKGKGYRVHAEYKLREDDGTVIHLLNVGNFFASEGRGVPFGFTSPSFEVPLGKHGWLNDGAYVGTLESRPDADGALPFVKIAVFKAKQA